MKNNIQTVYTLNYINIQNLNQASKYFINLG